MSVKTLKFVYHNVIIGFNVYKSNISCKKVSFKPCKSVLKFAKNVFFLFHVKGNVSGTEFLYSTHGFTLLAAVIENVTGEPFDKVANSTYDSFQNYILTKL